MDITIPLLLLEVVRFMQLSSSKVFIMTAVQTPSGAQRHAASDPPPLESDPKA
jgi:hypothetical protein